MKVDTMPGVWSGTRRGVHGGTPPPYALDRARNLLELDASQPESSPTPGVGREIYADEKSVPLPLYFMPRTFLHMERPALPLQK